MFILCFSSYFAGAASSANSASSAAEQNVSQFQTWLGVKPYNLLNFYTTAQRHSAAAAAARRQRCCSQPFVGGAVQSPRHQAAGGALLASLPVAAPPTCATPCGDSQTKEMCKSDLTLVGECVAEFLSDYRLVCQLARLQPNGFDRIGNSNESTEWHLLMTKVSYK